MKTTTFQLKHSINPSSWALAFLLVELALASLSFLPTARATTPAPEVCAPNFTAKAGCHSLYENTGVANTAMGWHALAENTDASFSTGVGAAALLSNNGDSNTAVGAAALLLNTTGTQNVAVGTDALLFNDGGSFNTANGAFALSSNTDGTSNTAIGLNTLSNNTTGSDNVAVGNEAGMNQDTGSGNVYIGSGIQGLAGESNACYIKSIFGQTSANGIPVLINSDNKLGTTTSSARFKEAIKPMDKTSEAILALRPVTFRYKKGLDPQGTQQCGLVAEEVEKVSPDLVVRDNQGKPYSVRYDQVNAMLLNEFLKEHHKVQELEANAAKQEEQIAALTTGLQKVSAQLAAANPSDSGLSKPASQTVLNTR